MWIKMPDSSKWFRVFECVVVVCGVCSTVCGSSVGFLARGHLTQRHSWAHVGLAQQVEVESDQEIEAQTITDTYYHFDERGTVLPIQTEKGVVWHKAMLPQNRMLMPGAHARHQLGP